MATTGECTLSLPKSLMSGARFEWFPWRLKASTTINALVGSRILHVLAIKTNWAVIIIQGKLKGH